MAYFSVIIPLYNKESFIEKTLECVLNQTFKDFEIIIVNDGSTDASLEKIKKFTDNRIKIFQQENQGVSVARNKGMEMAEGEYFCFLDADDEWKNDSLENLSPFLLFPLFSSLVASFPPFSRFPIYMFFSLFQSIFPFLTRSFSVSQQHLSWIKVSRE